MPIYKPFVLTKLISSALALVKEGPYNYEKT
ncbi:MAG: hypothetical protein JWQ28_3013 [Pedobacter sp.]|jgi:hypothetical protein|nr:hypothetical protein [Pedobacter sp.]